MPVLTKNYWLAGQYNKRRSANIKNAYKHIGAFQVVHSFDIVPQACGNLLYITRKTGLSQGDLRERTLSQGSQVSRNRCAESYCQRPSRYTSTSISIISPSPRVSSCAIADHLSPLHLLIWRALFLSPCAHPAFLSSGESGLRGRTQWGWDPDGFVESKAP